MSLEDRIVALEIALSHLERRHDELSDVAREQAGRIDLLERRLGELVELALAARDREDDAPPPHW